HSQAAGRDPRGARTHHRGGDGGARGDARPGERHALRHRQAAHSGAARGAGGAPGRARRSEREAPGDPRGRPRKSARRGRRRPGPAREGRRRRAVGAREKRARNRRGDRFACSRPEDRVTVGAAFVFFEEGQETAHGFLGIPSLAWQLLNLGLFLFLLWYFLRKPAADFFGNRKAGIAAALAKADDDRRWAEQLSVNLKEAARRDADAEFTALLAKSQSDADQILAKTRADLDNRVRAARAELTAFAGDLSVDLARDLLRKNVTAGHEKRLLAEGIAHLTSAAKGRGGAQ